MLRPRFQRLLSHFLRASLCLIFLIPTLLSALDLYPDLTRYEHQLEEQIQNKLNLLNSDDAKFIVMLHLIPDTSVANTPSPAAERVPSSEKDIDVGYMPEPLTSRETAAEIPGDTKNLKSSSLSRDLSKFAIGSVEASLYAYGNIDESLLESAKDIVKNSIKGLNPTIQVKKIQGALPKLPEASPSPTPTPAPKPEKPPFDWTRLLALIPVPLAGIMALAGFLVFASVFRNVAQGILATISLRSTQAAEKPGLSAKNDKIILAQKESAEANKKRRPNTKTEYHRYLSQVEFIKTNLRASPKLVVRTIRNQKEDWEGVRALLPHLSHEEQNALRSNLSPSVAMSLTNLPSAKTEQEEHSAWIENFVERLALEHFRGGSSVEKIIGEDLADELRSASPVDMISLFTKLRLGERSAAWRILGEFLGQDKIMALLKQSERPMWISFANSANLSEKEISQEATRLVSQLREISAHGPNREEQDHYLRSMIVTSLAGAIGSLAPGEDDNLLATISTHSPQLRPMIFQAVWTPSCLQRVPDKILSDAFRALSMDDKFALIFALPKPYSEQLEAKLPEGNMRVIIRDRIKRARDNPRELNESYTIVRAFLNRLREAHLAGDWELKPENPNSQTERKQAA